MKVAKNLAPSYTFSYYTEEDVEQEAIIFGLQALEKYDPSKSKLETFMYTHINNRLRGLKRSQNHRKNYICPHCANQDPTCHSCFKRNSYIEARKNLAKPLPLETARNHVLDNIEIHVVEINEILNLIDRHLPIELREDYLKIKDGMYIPKNRRDKVTSIIFDILETYYVL